MVKRGKVLSPSRLPHPALPRKGIKVNFPAEALHSKERHILIDLFIPCELRSQVTKFKLYRRNGKIKLMKTMEENYQKFKVVYPEQGQESVE